MRTAKRIQLLFLMTVLLTAFASAAQSAPEAAFTTPTIYNVTAGQAITTSSIVVSNATGVTQVDLSIPIPDGFTIDQTTNSSGNLSCVTAGSGAGTLFFASWNSSTNSIDISTSVNSGSSLTIISSIRMTAPSGWAPTSPANIQLSGTITGGSGSATFGTLSIYPVHAVTYSAQPAVSSNSGYPGTQVNCSATAVDNWGSSVTYQWSDGNAGGTFSSTSAQNPTYTLPANATQSDKSVTLTCVARSSSDTTKTTTGTTTLTVHPHYITISAGPTLTPSTIESAKTTTCSITAACSQSGHTVTYLWSDGNAGGTFSDAAVQNPTYTAAVNQTGTAKSVTITCLVKCAETPAVTASGKSTLTVNSEATNSIQVSSSPNTGAEITYSPVPTGLTSPKTANFTLTYFESATGISLTASATDKNSSHPRYFDHWILDSTAQTVGNATITVNMSKTNHTAEAVYSALVGDLNSDGKVDKTDADLILQKVLEDDGVTSTDKWDVNGDSKIDVLDARWILQHAYTPSN